MRLYPGRIHLLLGNPYVPFQSSSVIDCFRLRPLGSGSKPLGSVSQRVQSPAGRNQSGASLTFSTCGSLVRFLIGTSFNRRAKRGSCLFFFLLLFCCFCGATEFLEKSLSIAHVLSLYQHNSQPLINILLLKNKTDFLRKQDRNTAPRLSCALLKQCLPRSDMS